jgi:hypothetical protein
MHLLVRTLHGEIAPPEETAAVKGLKKKKNKRIEDARRCNENCLRHRSCSVLDWRTNCNPMAIMLIEFGDRNLDNSENALLTVRSHSRNIKLYIRLMCIRKRNIRRADPRIIKIKRTRICRADFPQ